MLHSYWNANKNILRRTKPRYSGYDEGSICGSIKASSYGPTTHQAVFTICQI